MTSESVKEFTDSNFEAQVLGASEPVLVDFGAEWCQPCRMLAPTIEEVAKEYDGRVVVGTVDIDANREISMKYGIANIPTVLVFKGGEVVETFVGLTGKDKFTAALDKALG